MSHIATMEESKSSTKDDVDDLFFDALDEFPFYDCFDTTQSDQSISQSSSISQLEPIEDNADVSHKADAYPDPSLALFRRRRSSSQHVREDISSCDLKDSNPNSSVSFDIIDTCTTAAATATTPRERKHRFSRNLKENNSESENSDSFKVRFSSGRINNCANQGIKENSIAITGNDEKIDDSITVHSHSGIGDESSSNFLFLLAGLVIKAIGFQINLLVSFFTFPIWLLYRSYMFVIDPFQVVRHGRQYLMRNLSRVCECVTPFIYEWLKEHKSIWKLALRFGWGLLRSVYVCFILVSLLVSSFIISGFVVRFFVQEPIQMKETLNFDYTKNSPVAFVSIISCPDVSCGVNCREKIAVGKLGGPRVIPPNHKLQATVSLKLPESNYNLNLGIFQVRVDFLSVHGKTLASSRHPCMLKFKSQPIRLLLTFLKIAPLLAGYFSESQTLHINFRGFTEADMPTACLKVIIEQRAEFRPGAGIPEIYAASLTLESELPLLKRILWYWKKTVFIWISMMTFTMELLFTLLCCKPFIIPRVRLRGGSGNSSAPQINRSAQR